MPQIHATCIAINARGVLLIGDSGSGKSDTALRLIDSGAVLVGDDQIVITKRARKLHASPHDRLRGMLEVRGVGVLSFPFLEKAAIFLAVQLVSRDKVERLPYHGKYDCENISLPLVLLHAFDASTPAKIRVALDRV